MSNSYHVIPEDGHWIVKKAGAERATRVTETQDEAISLAREICKNQDNYALKTFWKKPKKWILSPQNKPF